MRVHLDPRTRTVDGGRLLVGGSPLTVMRLARPVTETTADSPLGRRWLATGIGSPDLSSVHPVDADELTVVIPVRGSDADLARCRSTLTGLRVVVVDDASPVPITGATLRLARNRGPAAARNAGLEQVTTPYVAFVDVDVQVTTSDLLALAGHFADPDLAAVAPRIQGIQGIQETPAVARCWQRYDAAFSALDLGPDSGPVHPGTRISYVPSACLVARTSAIGDGFAIDLRLGEDVDLVWRLIDAGHRVRYDTSITAYHASRPTLGTWLARIHDYGTSAAPLAQRHGTHVAPAVLAPTTALAGAALLLRHPSAVPIAALAIARTARRLSTTVPPATAAQLATRGLGHAVEQQSALVLRHWSPALVLALPVSAQVRRLVLTALLVDTATALARGRRGLDPLTLALGRRASDLAYGFGLWRGAWRARSVSALLPRRSR